MGCELEERNYGVVKAVNKAAKNAYVKGLSRPRYNTGSGLNNRLTMIDGRGNLGSIVPEPNRRLTLDQAINLRGVISNFRRGAIPVKARGLSRQSASDVVGFKNANRTGTHDGFNLADIRPNL